MTFPPWHERTAEPTARLGTSDSPAGYFPLVITQAPRLSWGTDDDQGEHNTEPWCEQITRITPQLGMAAIKAAPVKPGRSHACSSSAVTQDTGTPG
jgi:hypothetical protein